MSDSSSIELVVSEEGGRRTKDSDERLSNPVFDIIFSRTLWAWVYFGSDYILERCLRRDMPRPYQMLIHHLEVYRAKKIQR